MDPSPSSCSHTCTLENYAGILLPEPASTEIPLKAENTSPVPHRWIIRCCTHPFPKSWWSWCAPAAIETQRSLCALNAGGSINKCYNSSKIEKIQVKMMPAHSKWKIWSFACLTSLAFPRYLSISEPYENYDASANVCKRWYSAQLHLYLVAITPHKNIIL